MERIIINKVQVIQDYDSVHNIEKSAVGTWRRSIVNKLF